MTTVGYGDVAARSYFGRAIALLTALNGIIVVALLVSAITASTEVADDESRVLKAIQRLESLQARRKIASALVGAVVHLWHARKRTTRGKGGSSRALQASAAAAGSSRSLASPPSQLETIARVRTFTRALSAWHQQLLTQSMLSREMLNAELLQRLVLDIDRKFVLLNDRLDEAGIGMLARLKPGRKSKAEASSTSPASDPPEEQSPAAALLEPRAAADIIPEANFVQNPLARAQPSLT